MRLDNLARVERLLARHPSAVLAEPESGRPCLVRRDEVLVSARDAAQVDEQVRRWVDRREDHADLEIARLLLRPSARVDVCELTSECAGSGPHHRRAVTPNHLLRGEPLYGGGPFDEPEPPRGALPEPPKPPTGIRRPVRVAVFDTGIWDHSWWDGREWFEACGNDTREVLDANLDYRLDAQAGHGTFVAGLIFRQVPDAELVVEKVLGSDGICDEFDLVRGLHQVYLTHTEGRPVDVLNLSLGGYTYDNRPSPHVARALARYGSRTAVVACAGNNGSDRPFWPAAQKRVIAVGALDAEGDDRAPFSNYGWWVDACALGSGVTSTFVTWDGPDQPTGDFDPDLFTGYAVWSGTSFATAQVSGAIADIAATAAVPARDAADWLLTRPDQEVLPDLGIVVDGTPSPLPELVDAR